MSYQTDFIAFMVEAGVLRFGDFITKSGRKTPFFINTGLYRTGSQIARLGEYYAAAVLERAPEAQLLFGPAYKGIPLAVTTAAALSKTKDIGFCFNRKEAKDHGEGGVLVGQAPQDGTKVVIVEDVITSGASMRETIPVLRAAAKVDILCSVISVDRKEKGPSGKSAVAEAKETFGFPVYAITDIDQIVDFLYNRELEGRVLIDDNMLARIKEYRAEYGV